ncbi:hypothetical protein [Stutzerimonas kirkiae]|uniref:hypothetical protein n=1 Tax=Stutzerimonas kirkiae TaxID=2211392 RepID=UPI00103859E1|nr:hypothetical protein [Stutzerimonas kirkiae]TBV10260.1 hypothetical protein DNK08_07215 [Stutzerimonas kirkiae]
MSFNDFMTDTIVIRKQNGEVIEGFKASVQATNIFLNRSDVLIEPLDLIERKASNGAVETYEVQDPGFNESFGGIEAHYQMRVRKLGLPEAKEKVQSITYNISGHNTRINHSSFQDNSSNTVNVGGDLREYMDALKEIVASISDTGKRQEASELLDAVEIQLVKEKPSRSVVKTLLEALPAVTGIAQLTTAILALL